MDPVVVTETAQFFNGIRYYLCGKYYQRDGKRLHRVVWETSNGPIPKGFHVHHVDENRANNALSNLNLLPGFEHLSLHGKEKPIEKQRATMDYARTFASAWHGSPEGIAWHRKHAMESIAKPRKDLDCICRQCGRQFVGRGLKPSGWCSQACRQKKRRTEGLDKVERICAACGRAFMVIRFSRQANCSRECGQRTRVKSGGCG